MINRLTQKLYIYIYTKN